MEYSKGQYEVYIIYTFHTCHWRCKWSTSRTFLFVCWCLLLSSVCRLV
jgi:hypothetical protein